MQNITHTFPCDDGTHVDMWYNPHTRDWVVQLKDAQCNQIGDAQFSYTREEACADVGYFQMKAKRSVA